MQESAEGIVGGCFTEGPNGSPKRGLNERSSHSVTRDGSASGKQGTLSSAKPGDETVTGKREGDTPVEVSEVMERVLERGNLLRALRQVTRNKGGPGVDGMTVERLPGYLKEHWPHIKAEFLSGRCKPQPVHRVEIPEQVVRRLTNRTRGKKIRQIISELMFYLIGWRGYYRFTEALSPLRDLDRWIRRRLRCYVWKQWGRHGYRELRERGVSLDLAWNTAKSAHGPWRLSQSPALSFALPERFFSDLGLQRLAA